VEYENLRYYRYSYSYMTSKQCEPEACNSRGVLPCLDVVSIRMREVTTEIRVDSSAGGVTADLMGTDRILMNDAFGYMYLTPVI